MDLKATVLSWFDVYTNDKGNICIECQDVNLDTIIIESRRKKEIKELIKDLEKELIK